MSVDMQLLSLFQVCWKKQEFKLQFGVDLGDHLFPFAPKKIGQRMFLPESPNRGDMCRDFAVLEDHTLAHSLQEQEIEHHLASNIQRNRLVQHDLQVAKQLQEEDLKAQAQLQKRYKDLEQQDCEIAQEIQEKLAIEAERRRIQEKKDEDIARLLQEKELQEEKKRKKHFPESSGSSAYGDNYYYENGDQPQSRRARELGSGVSRSCRLQSDGNTVKQRKEKPKHPMENLEELEDYCSSGKLLSSCSSSKVRGSPHNDSEQRERKRSDHERLRRPPLPKISGEVFLSTGFDDWEANSSHRTQNWEKKSRQQDRLSPKSSQKSGLHYKEAVYGRDRGQGEHRERKHRPRTPPFSESEKWLQLHDTGMKPRGMKEAVSTPSRVAHRDQEWYDAEIARKLQEEEILATQVDMRAAQVAQDEEIARLLMAEEKKAYKKAKEREKSSLDKRKHDPDWKPKTTKSAHSKSKESDDPHRSKNDRPASAVTACLTSGSLFNSPANLCPHTLHPALGSHTELEACVSIKRQLLLMEAGQDFESDTGTRGRASSARELGCQEVRGPPGGVGLWQD
ncbi:coiled-coil domain-containing protein 50 [Puma concolor]|uniref:Coiled-coil domain-containing protein 50 n=1 Tax=Puma concolor TaxID=9696 RepID=A0A6P6H0Y0_PUMCO|nr:coiled-coil domain-containing protein 50 [Puma concolor]